MLVPIILLLPISVYAGAVSSFISNIFKVPAETGKEFSNRSVQNMALLVASAAPLGENAANHIPTIENDALVSGAGPLGADPGTVLHKPTSDQISIYVVRKGDTLSQIAEMFNVSVNTIKWGNDLSSNTLKEGQVLVILPISGIKHTVAKGETIESLAKKYKGDIGEIMAYNNLQKGASLAVGSEIIIPDGEIVPESIASGASVSRVGNQSSLKEFKGYYLRPVVGGVRTQGIHGYNAVDLAGPVGTPILASADGEVIIARTGGWNGGYGDYVVLRHPNGTQTLYAHASKILVSTGDSVKQGETIALIGATGKATGPHLHFEIRGAKNPF